MYDMEIRVRSKTRGRLWRRRRERRQPRTWPDDITTLPCIECGLCLPINPSTNCVNYVAKQATGNKRLSHATPSGGFFQCKSLSSCLLFWNLYPVCTIEQTSRNIKQAWWNPAPWLKCRPRLSPQRRTCYNDFQLQPAHPPN